MYLHVCVVCGNCPVSYYFHIPTDPSTSFCMSVCTRSVLILHVHHLFLYVCCDVCSSSDSTVHLYIAGSTYSHVLAVADEEGSLRLLNIKKVASQSLVKGSHISRIVH